MISALEKKFSLVTTHQVIIWILISFSISSNDWCCLEGTEVEGGLQEMKDLSEELHKRNWDSKNSIRRKRKKEKLLKQKSYRGKKYTFAKGSMTKSSW